MAAFKAQFKKKELENKILGCWYGKNIGGTMGAPYEGRTEMLSVTGYNTPLGEPLPNDDLDLQLVWLEAMEKEGPGLVDANVLAEYWLCYVTPHWNEYGIGKSNLNMGLLPPLSGEFKNIWKNSNGAWIRSELWACLAPGMPNIAVKYAIMDASVDHGLAEGTYAEMFTASLESMAFFESDIRKLIEKALTYIPKECRIAKSVNLVLDSYDAGIPWQEVREKLVKESEDIGMFQAPANVGFVVLGLMYGEGDFKKSVLYTINCGDDTDCTGATCGAILGIILGCDKIPTDWKEYIGDRIVTVCINASYRYTIAKSCTELTQRIIKLMPDVMKAHEIDLEYTEDTDFIDERIPMYILNDYAEKMFKRSPYSFEIARKTHMDVIVEYDSEPIIKPNGNFKVRITIKNNRRNAYHCEFTVGLPDGWSADYERTAFVQLDEGTWEMTIYAGEKVDSVNKIPVMISPQGHVMPVTAPIVLLG